MLSFSGISLKKKRDQPEKESKREGKKETRGDQSSLSEARYFIFKRTFIPFPQMILCILCSALEACETFYDPPLIKTAQPENLFSLKVFFLYISNLCQPQKVSNKVTFLTEQRCSNLQQRKNQLAQKSDVVNFKATLVFLTFQLC